MTTRTPKRYRHATIEHANQKVCKVCGAHQATPTTMANGKLCYKCPMGHFWYESPREG